MHAAEGRANLVKFLLENTDINNVDLQARDNGETFLMMAAERGYEKIANQYEEIRKILIDAGASKMDKKGNDVV